MGSYFSDDEITSIAANAARTPEGIKFLNWIARDNSGVPDEDLKKIGKLYQDEKKVATVESQYGGQPLESKGWIGEAVDGLKRGVDNLQGSAATLFEGSVPLNDEDTAIGRFVQKQGKEAAEILPSREVVLGNKVHKAISEGMQSVPLSLGTSAAGFVAGSALSGGNPIVGALTAGGTTGALMYKPAKQQFVRQVRDALKEQYNVTPEQWDYIQNQIEDAAQKTGIYEVTGEGVSEFFEYLIFRMPIGKIAKPLAGIIGKTKADKILGSTLASIVAKGTGTVAAENIGEGFTQERQTAALSEVPYTQHLAPGYNKEDPYLSRLATGIKDVAGATTVASLVQAGGLGLTSNVLTNLESNRLGNLSNEDVLKRIGILEAQAVKGVKLTPKQEANLNVYKSLITERTKQPKAELTKEQGLENLKKAVENGQDIAGVEDTPLGKELGITKEDVEMIANPESVAAPVLEPVPEFIAQTIPETPLAPETSLGTLPAEASSVSPKAPEQVPDYTADAEKLGIAFNGMQERFNKPSLPMFTDNKTGSSFMVAPDETLESALQRTRDGYKSEVKPVAEDVKPEAKEPFRMTKDEFAETVRVSLGGKSRSLDKMDIGYVEAKHRKQIGDAVASGKLTREEAIALHKPSYPGIETWPEMKPEGKAKAEYNPEKWDGNISISKDSHLWDIDEQWDSVILKEEAIKDRNAPKIQTLRDELKSIKSSRDKKAIARKKKIQVQIDELKDESDLVRAKGENAFLEANLKISDEINERIKSEGFTDEETIDAINTEIQQFMFEPRTREVLGADWSKKTVNDIVDMVIEDFKKEASVATPTAPSVPKPTSLNDATKDFSEKTGEGKVEIKVDEAKTVIEPTKQEEATITTPKAAPKKDIGLVVEDKNQPGMFKEEPKFTRAKSSGMPITEVQKLANGLTAGMQNIAPVKVFQNIKDLNMPVDVLDKMNKANVIDEEGNSDVAGMLWKGNIYLFADNISSDIDVARTVVKHEMFHDGFAKLMEKMAGRSKAFRPYNTDLKALLNEIWTARETEVRQHAKEKQDQLKIDDKDAFVRESARRRASEEWLANQAPASETKWYDRLVAIFQNFMKAMGFKGFSDSQARVLIGDAYGVLNAKQQGFSFSDGMARFAMAFHGTPHIWSPEKGFPHGRPRLDKIGTGEGAAAYGWGWYSAESEGVAHSYKNIQVVVNGKPYFSVVGQLGDTAQQAISFFQKNNFNKKEAIAALEKDKNYAASSWLKANDIQIDASLYKLDIPNNVIPKLLDWDKPLSEQSEYVKERLEKSKEIKSIIEHWKGVRSGLEKKLSNRTFSREAGDIAGERLYQDLSFEAQNRRLPTQQDSIGKVFDWNARKDVSEYLASIGIPGNKYLDQMSRGKSEGTYNYVIWDQKVLDQIALLERNGEKLDAIRESGTFSPTDPNIMFTFKESEGMPMFTRAANTETSPMDTGMSSKLMGILSGGKDAAFNNTGIIYPSNDSKDLYKGVRWLQTMYDLARNYPEMKGLLDVQTKRQADSHAMTLADRELTKPFYELNKESRNKTGEVLFKGDEMGRVFTDSELKTQFELNPEEISGYKAIRQTLDRKLDVHIRQLLENASTGMIKITQEMIEAVKTSGNNKDFTERLIKLGMNEKDIERVTWMLKWSKSLKGYMPHKWDSKWLVKITLPQGKEYLLQIPTIKGSILPTRGMRHSAAQNATTGIINKELGLDIDTIKKYNREGRIELVRATDLPVDLFQGARLDVLQSIVNEARERMYKDYAKDLDSETLDKLDTMKKSLGTYLEEMYLAKGFGRHLMGRRGVLGYRKDTENVIAEYLVGANSFLSKGKASKEFAKAFGKISPKKTPLMWQHGKEYISDMLGESNEAGWFKKIAGTYFLAADLSAAALNLTQNFTHAVPMMRAIDAPGGKTAEMEIMAAMKDVAGDYIESKKTDRLLFTEANKFISKDEIDFMHRLKNEGNLDPQYLGEMSGLHTNKIWENYTQQGWSMLFHLFTGAEGLNRTSTALAVYRRAIRAGMTSQEAEAKAVDIINSAHGLYGRGNRPLLVRRLGAIGNIGFTFMAYPVNNLVYLKHRTEELLSAIHAGDKVAIKQSMKVIGSNLGYLFALGGVLGLPFAYLGQIAFDIFDDDEDDWEILMRKYMSRDMGRAVSRGLPAAIIGNDFSWRVQGTDVIGVPIGFQIMGMAKKRAEKAQKLWKQDRMADAIFALMPDMFRNPYAAAMGYYEGAQKEGRAPIKYTVGETITKGLGFTPTREAEAFKVGEVVNKKKAMRQGKINDWSERYLVASTKKDARALDKIRMELVEFNKVQKEKKAFGITIGMSDIIQSAQRKKKTREKGYLERRPEYMGGYQKGAEKALGLQ